MIARSFGTQSRFGVELPRLVHLHGTSLRAVAKAADVDASYLHQVLKGDRAPSEKLLAGAASYFEIPPAHFREYRELVVMKRVRADASVLDRVYEIVTRDS